LILLALAIKPGHGYSLTKDIRAISNGSNPIEFWYGLYGAATTLRAQVDPAIACNGPVSSQTNICAHGNSSQRTRDRDQSNT